MFFRLCLVEGDHSQTDANPRFLGQPAQCLSNWQAHNMARIWKSAAKGSGYFFHIDIQGLMIWIGRAHGFCQEASLSVPQSVWGKLLWIEIMEIAPRATWGLRWKERIVGVHNTNTGVHKSLVYTDTSAHKHRCKHRCTQWGLEWLWKQENVSRSWGVTVRCPCTLYIVHTVQPILFKYLPSVRQNTTTSRIKDVHWLLLSGSPTDMHLDVRSRWVGEPDYDFCCTILWYDDLCMLYVCLFLGLCAKLWVVRG